ncbi:MAG TPA: HAD-IIA family hydrolase [Chloroflexia bacterium]|nr:HAD-IIA family hydrolase [Chloroflexia bacterium]
MAAELEGKISGLVLDMDGVLYRGNHALEGARELFPALRAAGLSFILLTNNATLTAQDFTAKLARMGIAVPPDAILTSSGATAMYMEEHFPEGGGVYVLGESGLLTAISSAKGFRLDGWQPSFVVVGLYFKFDYDSLQRACSAIRRGARFVATNQDATLPVEGGELWPGAGSIVAAIQTCSGVAPTVIGKPNTHMAEVALDLLELPAEQVLCVGDRLETDILMGERAGMPTALLLTGVSQQADIETTGIQPDYIYDNLYSLMSALGIRS